MKDNNSIVNRIIDSANGKADVIIGEARVRAQDIITKAELEARSFSSSANGQLRLRTGEILERKCSVDRLDGKRLLADSRYSLMDKTYALVISSIKAMKDADYKALIKSILLVAAEDCDIVHISNSDNKRIDSALVKAVAEAKSIKLTLSDKYVDIDGGVYLEGGGYDKNYCISAMVNRLREELDTAVASVLFEVK